MQEAKVAERNNLNEKDSEKSSIPNDSELNDSSEDATLYEKPCKIKKTYAKNSNDDALRELTNAAINICTQMNTSTSHENLGSKSADHAFSEFVALSLQGMEEPERTIRRNKIFQDLTAPLDQLL